MKRYWAYLRYVLRHKWFVLLECWKRGLYWRGLVHDLSMFSPREFTAYARHFYNANGSRHVNERDDPTFARAWLSHVHSNPHHWQYYVLVDNGPPSRRADKPAANVIIYPMSRRDVIEMVCDWIAMGRGNKYHVLDWWEANKFKVILDPTTRDFLEHLLVDVSNERMRTMPIQPRE